MAEYQGFLEGKVSGGRSGDHYFAQFEWLKHPNTTGVHERPLVLGTDGTNYFGSIGIHTSENLMGLPATLSYVNIGEIPYKLMPDFMIEIGETALMAIGISYRLGELLYEQPFILKPNESNYLRSRELHRIYSESTTSDAF